MMSDSAIPNIESNSNYSEPAEVHPKAFAEDINNILPEAEVNTVLHFISSPPMHGDTPHFISSSVTEDETSNPLLLETQIEVEYKSHPSVSTPVNEYQRMDFLPDNGEIKIEEIIASSVPTGVTPSTDITIKESPIVVDSPSDNSDEVLAAQEAKEVTSNHDSSDITIPAVEDKKTELDNLKATEEVSIIPELTSLGEFDLNALDAPLQGSLASRNIQVQLKSEAERLVIILPTEKQLAASEYSWYEIWQQLKQRLNAGDRLRVANTNVHLVAGDRLLDARQLQELAESLNEIQLQLKSVATSRRQTAIASVTSGYSVEQLQAQSISLSSANLAANPLAEPLYMEMTIRSGVEIRHPGTVIVLGDINPGGSVVADADIIVWGRLRGVAHAGATGNKDCLIMALQMEPTQLRIADAVARAPEKLPKQFHAEVAYITNDTIRIAKASDFSRSNRISFEGKG
jgi:septum site-determining protein MinC